MGKRSLQKQYATKYGPTKGDKVRLADTNLVIEVEKDYTVYGEELRFGMGGTVRSGMGMSARATRKEALDLIITNALIVDYWGIVKADIGIKNGRIHGIGKGGNPDYMDGVSPNMIVGASTEVISGEGLIVTAGGVDSHVHQISPQIVLRTRSKVVLQRYLAEEQDLQQAQRRQIFRQEHGIYTEC